MVFNGKFKWKYFIIGYRNKGMNYKYLGLGCKNYSVVNMYCKYCIVLYC